MMTKSRFKIEFGPENDRKVKDGLRQAAVMSAYRSLIAADEQDISIITPSGELIEDVHQFSLNTEHGGVRWSH